MGEYYQTQIKVPGKKEENLLIRPPIFVIASSLLITPRALRLPPHLRSESAQDVYFDFVTRHPE